MLFFMGAASHMTWFGASGATAAYWIVALVVILAAEINCLVGPGLASQKPLGSVSGTIHFGLILTLVLYLVGMLLL